MTLKKYKIIKLVIIALIAAVFAQAIVLKNYLIPIAILVVASLVLMMLRKRVTEIMTDERDRITGGKSALLAIQIYSWIAVISMLILYSLRDLNPSYEAIGTTLAYSTCLLMITYSLIFHFYNKASLKKYKWKYLAIVLVLALLMFIFTLRLFSGEDNWICKNGEWVKHGHPSFPAPQIECK